MSYLVLTNGNMLRSDGSWTQGSLVIENDRIVEISEGGYLPKNARVVDVDRRWIIPGLIDAHVHTCLSPDMGEDGPSQWLLIGARNAAAYLRAGITTVRDVGAPAKLNIELARAIDRGLVPGPRILACGQHLTITGGHLHWFGRQTDGEVEMQKAAREQLQAGARLLKFMASGGAGNADDDESHSELSQAEMAAGVVEARRAGVRTAAHAHTEDSISAAICAGVNTIEHGTYLTDRVIDLLLEFDAAVIPTVAVYQDIANNTSLAPGYRAVGRRVSEARPPYFQEALRRGVCFGVGTDASVLFPAAMIVDEMKAMAQLGMSNTQVLQAATAVNARLIGLEREVGSIEPGKIADLVVLDGNPVEDLDQLRSISSVIKAGQLYGRKEN